MKLIVAGAGAGKTSSMAQLVLDRYNETESKIIYVITYTNAAKNHIKNKIKELYGIVPKRILVETIHSFLLREFIFPYHHLLYEQQYTRASQIKLPDDFRYKAAKLKELGTNKHVHVEKVTEIAKWIIFGKTSDKKAIKEKREKILSIVSRYLDSVFVDEAQDMDNHFLKIIEVLEGQGINLCLVGDPKQDLRGRFAFNELIDTNSDRVTYKPENHRCPVSHVLFANTYISDEEKQVPMNETLGELNFSYESELNVGDLLSSKKWEYAYIYKKNQRFLTHATDNNIAEKSLEYELKALIAKSGMRENEIDKNTFVLKKYILGKLPKLKYYQIFSLLERILSINLTNQDKGKLSSSLTLNVEVSNQNGLVINSIDSIKGLEADNCIFVLTTDLAPYLLKEKTEKNKMLNYLYVAITRSKKELLILVTREVEEKYSKAIIDCKFQSLGINYVSYRNAINPITIA